MRAAAYIGMREASMSVVYYSNKVRLVASESTVYKVAIV